MPFDQVAALASSRTFHLNSAFRPTYNMAANLVRSYTSERAHHLLNLSFAQYQADRDVVRIEARLERRQQHLADLLERAHSPYGDLDEYRRRAEGRRQARRGRRHHRPRRPGLAGADEAAPRRRDLRREGPLRRAGGGAVQRAPQGWHAASRASPRAATW